NKTGIQILPINTIFQLYKEESEYLQKAKNVFLIPDYLNYKLTQVSRMEATNASTTQLFNLEERALDVELLTILGIEKEKFPPLTEPGRELGTLKRYLFPEYNLPESTVINVTSHDTASA